MESFEELGLNPELVDVLAAEGIERPYASQEALVPLVTRGGNILGTVGPGSGAFTAVLAGLFDRLLSDEEREEGADATAPARILVLTPSAATSDEVARSIASIAHPLGFRTSALGTRWALPELSTVLVSDPKTLHDLLRRSRIKLSALTSVVLQDGRGILERSSQGDLDAVLETVPKESQRIVLSTGPSSTLQPLVDRFARKAVQYPPPEAIDARRAAHAKSAGRELTFTMAKPKAPSVLATVDLWLGEDIHHVVVYSRTEEAAADIGDFLTLHGFLAGAPGDLGAPVWVTVDPFEPDAELEQAIGSISSDVPADPEGLENFHGPRFSRSHVVLDPTERDHLRTIAPLAGFRARPVRPILPESVRSEVEALRTRLAGALDGGGLAPFYLLLEPFLEEWDPAEVAAAALSLLAEPTETVSGPPPPRPRTEREPSRGGPSEGGEWAKLFVSVGERDGAAIRDLLGAVTGETGISGSDVGKIDMRDTFSIVEVKPSVAQKVIRGLNGTTIRGRSARVDFHRPRSPSDRDRGRPSGDSRRRGPRSD